MFFRGRRFVSPLFFTHPVLGRAGARREGLDVRRHGFVHERGADRVVVEVRSLELLGGEVREFRDAVGRRTRLHRVALIDDLEVLDENVEAVRLLLLRGV